MSLNRGEELVEQIVEAQPALGAFVSEVPELLNSRSWHWDALSYGFQLGFETLWDHAYADHAGNLLHPVLVLWRHSVELALKAAIIDIAGEIAGKPGHNLEALFEQLLKVRGELGFCDADDLARDVRTMVASVQSVDPFADRFRYPASKGGTLFEGMDADLDQLFQAHWIIVTYCEGAALEVEEARNAG